MLRIFGIACALLAASALGAWTGRQSGVREQDPSQARQLHSQIESLKRQLDGQASQIRSLRELAARSSASEGSGAAALDGASRLQQVQKERDQKIQSALYPEQWEAFRQIEESRRQIQQALGPGTWMFGGGGPGRRDIPNGGR